MQFPLFTPPPDPYKLGAMRFIHMIILAALISLTGAPINAQQSQRGLTAATAQLFDAVRRKDLGAAQAAIAAGADLESRDSFGLRPVDLAIDLGNFDIAHHLLSVSNLRLQSTQPKQPSQAAPAVGAAPATVAPVTAAPQPAARPLPTPAASTPLPPAPALTGPSAFDPKAVPKTFAPPIIGDVMGPGTPGLGRVAPAPTPAPAQRTRPQLPPANESRLRQPVPDSRLRSMISATQSAPPARAANAPKPIKMVKAAAAKPEPITINQPVTPIQWPPLAAPPAATPVSSATEGSGAGNPPAAVVADDQPGLLSRFTNLFKDNPAASEAKAEAPVAPPGDSPVLTASASRQKAAAADFPPPTVAPRTTASEASNPDSPTIPAVEPIAVAASQPTTELPSLMDRLTGLFSFSETTPESLSESTAESTPTAIEPAKPDMAPVETVAPVKTMTPIKIVAPQTKPAAKPAEAPLPAEAPISVTTTTPDTSPSFFDRLTGWFKPSASADANVGTPEIAALPKTVSVPLPPGAPKVSLEILHLGKFKRLGQSRIVEKVSPNDCIEKRFWNVLFCVEPVTWPPEIAKVFTVGGSLYRGAKTIVRYDNDIATQFHTVFLAEDFDTVTAYFRKQLGPPSATPDIITAMVAAPPLRNPTLRWTSDGAGGSANLEVRQIDDLRWVMPDTQYGVVRLYREKSESVFRLPSVSDLALARLRRPDGG
jgi:hypothetical protein